MKSFASRLAVASVLCLVVAARVEAAEPLRVAVLPIKAQTGVKPELGEVITEQLAAAIQKRRYTVMSPEDLTARLGFERQRQLLGCTDATCLVEVGQALGVDRLVSGSIAMVGKSVVISLVLINNKSGAVEYRYSERVKNGTDEAFLDLVPVAVSALFPSDAVAAEPVGVVKSEPAAPPSSGLRIGAWVSLGVGVAALATGGAFFGIARGMQKEVSEGTLGSFASLQDKVAAGKTNDVIGVTAMSVGGALAITSIVLFIVGPTSGPTVSFAPSPGGGVFVVGGQF